MSAMLLGRPDEVFASHRHYYYYFLCVLYFVSLFTRYFPLKQTHCLNFKFASKGNLIPPLPVRDNMYHSLPKIESGFEKYICGGVGAAVGGPPGLSSGSSPLQNETSERCRGVTARPSPPEDLLLDHPRAGRVSSAHSPAVGPAHRELGKAHLPILRMEKPAPGVEVSCQSP